MNGDEVTLLIGLGGIACVGGFCTVVVPLFLLTLQTALSRCRPRNRGMMPGLVWLNLIPVWQQVWSFVTCVRVSRSLAAEYRARGMNADGSFAAPVGLAGLAAGWLSAGMGVFGNAMAGRVDGSVLVLGYAAVWAVLTLAAVVLGVVYWAKVASLSRALITDGDRRDRELDHPPADDDGGQRQHHPRSSRRSGHDYDDDYR